MFSIRINGVSFSGKSISIISGKVFVDGADKTPDGKTITIDVQGDVETINADAVSRITVTGNVGRAESGAGNIDVRGDILGNAETGAGNITVTGSLGGNAESGAGNVRIGSRK